MDSLQGRGPSQIFTPVCSIPELEALVYNWTFFETNIHSRSYSHIIRNIYNVPKDVFNTIHDTQEIVDMASSVGDHYDQLHMINCHKELGSQYSEEAHIRAIWLALNASYALEAFRQGVERGSGVVRDVAASLECARRLAEKGVDAGKVLELAVQATIDNRKNRKDPPMTLDQVAKWGGLE